MGGGIFVQKITAPVYVPGDRFGEVVAISNTNIVIGASQDGDNGFSSGSVYLYSSEGIFVRKITAPDGAAGDEFGWPVAISNTNIVIGASEDDDNGFSSGSVYLYSSGGIFVQKIIAPDGAAEDYFGSAVAISNTNIVIGAWGDDDNLDDDNGSSSGSVYLYSSGGSFVRKITAPDGADGDYFGRAVSILNTNIIIGAFLDDDDDIGSN